MKRKIVWIGRTGFSKLSSWKDEIDTTDGLKAVTSKLICFKLHKKQCHMLEDISSFPQKN